MIIDRLLTLGGIRIANIALTIAHDQQALHPVIRRAFLHFAEVLCVLRLVHEELVHVFHGENSVLRCHLRKIEIVDLTRAQFRIDRPLRERDPQRRHILGQSRPRGECTGRQAGLGQKLSARKNVGKLHAQIVRSQSANSIVKRILKAKNRPVAYAVYRAA